MIIPSRRMIKASAELTKPSAKIIIASAEMIKALVSIPEIA
jgi:hypothetical protein